MTWLRERCVADWRRAHKWASIRLSAIGALLFSVLASVPEILPQLWATIPSDVREFLPAGVKALLPTLFALAFILARLTKKKDKPDA